MARQRATFTRPSSIVDAQGVPMRRSFGFGRGRAYEAADPASQDLGSWHPGTWSADSALAEGRQRLADRLHDLVRNDGWASGTVTSFVNTAIGPSFWFSSMPDHAALGISFDEALVLGQQIEDLWWSHATDFRRLADRARRATLPEFFALQFRHLVIDGECITLPAWRERLNYGLRTCFQAMHPARLSNPNEGADSRYLRAGIELDDDGAAVAYNFRRAHPGDANLSESETWIWDRVEREFSWGRPRVIHHFRANEAEETRGVSPFAPIVRRLKMNQRYEAAELQAALANAVLAAYIETSLPPEAMSDLLSGGTEMAGGLEAQEQRRMDWYEAAPVSLNGLRIPVLPIGDRVNFPAASRPNQAQDSFVGASLRYMAAATGLNPSTISRDYSQTNYSSERAAMLEGWRTIMWARETFAGGQATPMLACVIEEGLERGLIDPGRARPFWEAPMAWLAGEWIGPARGWVDPVKEASAAKLRMEAGLSTLKQEAAEQGLDYQDLLRQQAREQREREALGLPPAGGGASAVSFVERDAAGNESETRIGGRP